MDVLSIRQELIVLSPSAPPFISLGVVHLLVMITFNADTKVFLYTNGTLRGPAIVLMRHANCPRLGKISSLPPTDCTRFAKHLIGTTRAPETAKTPTMPPAALSVLKPFSPIL